MKVKVTYTIEVDPVKWAAEFHIGPGEVRADVRAAAHAHMDEYVRSLGLAPESKEAVT